MPLYEYKCDRCGEVFEVMQKFSDTPLETHEKCGGHVERLLSPPALQFKGTGWYVTDYARGSGNGKQSGKHEGAKGESKGEKKDSGAKSGSGETSAPAKPASGSSSTDKK